MAKKAKKGFVCTECGADFPKWMGQCSECKEWHTVKEVNLGTGSRPSPGKAKSGYAGATSKVQTLSEVEVSKLPRLSTDMSELDRVLGGGFVLGEAVLIAGDPGAGKSTLLLQVLGNMSKREKVLYVTGEESVSQVAQRGQRLQVPMDNIRILAETSVQQICQVAEEERPRVMVIDSVQVMYNENVESSPGSVSQVRESAAYLTQFAKNTNTIMVIVGHFTKDNNIAGPKTLQHIVDALLKLSSTDDSRYRLLRAEKNRFGSIEELGCFAMTGVGLREVKNPSAMFLARAEQPSPGSVVNVLWEGTRPLLVEVQALVVDSQHGNPRRLGVGVDQNRLAMLLAVLTRHGGLNMAQQDVFINCVGGVKITEPSADLAVSLGIVSSFQNRVIPQDVCVFGEIGLSGEIRPVANGDSRIKDAFKHGFKTAIIPKANMPKQWSGKEKVYGVATLTEALDVMESVRV